MRAWGFQASSGEIVGEEGRITGLNDLRCGVFVSDKSELRHKKAQKPQKIMAKSLSPTPT
jgi:hypothetical protein